ncbi:amino acid adenylation domain-containing protein [Streptomyces sp. NRRL F-5065]|uniref:amino acid adenylation domain-containing protein n=1 Tax=Streptomyces sp. NRRL F-5065 TaxID=1463855 RepID=UPI00068ADB8D|nr:amino acid adenylation domain-containing protein [Streptomyces sp. NRRL F-5065]
MTGRDATGRGAWASLTEAFESSTARRADATALVAEDGTFTYRRLEQWTRAVGALLRSRGVRPGDRVALRMPPTAAAVAAVLGILRAGAAYVPLDIRNPRARNEFVVRDAEATAFVGDPEGAAGEGMPVVGAEEIAALLDEPAPDVPPADVPRPGRDDEAYVIYTSGTTGRPKGVPIHHGAVLALLAGAGQRFSFRPDDRWLLFHSLAFDVSVWEIWGALSTGARLVVMPHWTARSPEECLRFVAGHGITVLSQTPTAFSELSAAACATGAALPALRYVVFGGEKLLPASLGPWTDRHGLARPTLVNMYGITETTVHSTYHEVTQDDVDGGRSVIGRPLPGFAFRVVADDGSDVPPGEQGELWLAGPQVSRGYLNRPELTAERFVDGPAPDGGPALRYYRSGDLVSRDAAGDLVSHGRADLQVKLRGYRVELSDVEAAVRSHPLVANAVVWVRGYGPGDDRLVCALVPVAGGPPPDARSLRRHVKGLLPSYMQPTGFEAVERLPRTTNGKVDRAETARLWEEKRGRAR